jgi:aspartate kinase
MSRIKNELGVDSIYLERGLSVIMIVGEGMRFTVGLSALASKAFADAGINVEMINQGSSEISIMYGVKSDDRIKAVKSLYKTFFGDK